MYEGKLPKSPHGFDRKAVSGAAKPLRPMTWSDLRARLEAARDLRLSVNPADESELASFDAGSARRIAAQAEGKRGVNPRDLGDRKYNDCKEGGENQNRACSPRGNE